MTARPIFDVCVNIHKVVKTHAFASRNFWRCVLVLPNHAQYELYCKAQDFPTYLNTQTPRRAQKTDG